MEKVMPGWCRLMKACRDGRYVLLPRDETISNTYAALNLVAAVVEAEVIRLKVARR
ncbi:hypothetical protein [Xanthobacter flavus]|nr:hypothetical protein [Xanthobacter flavus]MBP2148221.1 hypothetical protein [Xanthobacter flavus]